MLRASLTPADRSRSKSPEPRSKSPILRSKSPMSRSKSPMSRSKSPMSTRKNNQWCAVSATSITDTTPANKAQATQAHPRKLRRRAKRKSGMRRDSCSSSGSDTERYQRPVQPEVIINAVEMENKLEYLAEDKGEGRRCSSAPRQRRNSAESQVSVLSVATAAAANNPWAEFSEYVKSIDVDSMSFQQKKFIDRCSRDFQTVMGELETDSHREQRRAQGLRRALTRFKLTAGKSKLSVPQDADADTEEEEVDGAAQEQEVSFGEKARRKMSVRRWNVVKGQIDDQLLEKKKAEKVTGWKLLSKTMAHMTDTERARALLYERYLQKPHSWAEGFSQTNYPSFLRDREEREKEEQRKRRPMTAETLSRNKHGQRNMRNDLDASGKEVKGQGQRRTLQNRRVKSSVA